MVGEGKSEALTIHPARVYRHPPRCLLHPGRSPHLFFLDGAGQLMRAAL